MCGKSGAYNIVDNEPVTVREWLPWYAELLGAPPPMRVPESVARQVAGPYGVYMMTQLRGASKRKAKQKLGWAPRFVSWREGFRAEFGSRA